MNLIITQPNLRRALHVVERIVSKSVSLPILSTVLLKTENGRLRLSATNLEMGINYWINAKINKDGEITVPARIFSDFISNVNDEKVELKSEKNVMAIDSEHYKTKILGMESKDFPLIPRSKGNSHFKINNFALKEALLSVLDAASLSDTRPEISGVFVKVAQNKAEFAATDSFRLAEKIIDLAGAVEKSLILPRNTALELVRLSEENDGDLAIVIDDNQIFVLGGDFEFVSRLIDGHYPEYKRVIPEKFISLAKVNRGEFERKIRLASIFSSAIADIRLSASEAGMEIKAKNADRGEIVVRLPCQVKDEQFELSVNYHYLLDGLKIIPTENVLIQFTGEGSPLVLRAEDKRDQNYVIMPLRS